MAPDDIELRAVELTRRELLQLALATTAAGGLPLRRVLATVPVATRVTEFLRRDELALVEAITARIIPTDTTPGAREAGVAHYIQALLSSLPTADGNCDQHDSAADLIAIARQNGAPADPECRADLDGDGQVNESDLAATPLVLFNRKPIFAGGPFSGRLPYGDFDNGTISDIRPGNSFLNSVPLNRVQRLAWKVRLDGADAVPEVGDNPLARSLDEVDLRRRYRAGLAAVAALSQTLFGVAFESLNPTQQSQVLAAADADFVDLITNHTVEGLFCAPEYGGNRNLVGWQLIGFDGDSQPLGYTLGFDQETQQYLERADKPNSRPDPTETCTGFSSGVIRFLSLVISADDTQPAMRFRSPYCFDVDD